MKAMKSALQQLAAGQHCPDDARLPFEQLYAEAGFEDRDGQSDVQQQQAAHRGHTGLFEALPRGHGIQYSCLNGALGPLYTFVLFVFAGEIPVDDLTLYRLEADSSIPQLLFSVVLLNQLPSNVEWLEAFELWRLRGKVLQEVPWRTAFRFCLNSDLVEAVHAKTR